MTFFLKRLYYVHLHVLKTFTQVCKPFTLRQDLHILYKTIDTYMHNTGNLHSLKTLTPREEAYLNSSRRFYFVFKPKMSVVQEATCMDI
jgi:hypothetical protein